MRSPKDMRNIQVDITNACVHECSNCTRFCGHHKKTFFMSFDTFKQAVDSLQDFPGTMGIIGGEPTLHPEFERFVRYARKSRMGGEQLNTAREPIANMQNYIWKYLDGYWQKRRLGLWSSLNLGYYKHFEIINDSFPRQLLNDHNNKCLHQALLMSRRDLGIPDEEWYPKRDACWVQNTWSATITPKGAFFCEVAGALDMLFDGPGGWPVERGWWLRKPQEFGEQLQWCEMCGGCLDVPKRISNDERDDVTPGIFERLKAIGSPKALAGRCVVHDPKDYEQFKDPTFTKGTDYMTAGGNVRTTAENRNLYPKKVTFVQSGSWREDMKREAPEDWVAIIGNDERDEVLSFTEKYILNPGCTYYVPGKYILFNVLAKSVRDYVRWPQLLREDIMSYYPADKCIEITPSLQERLSNYM